MTISLSSPSPLNIKPYPIRFEGRKEVFQALDEVQILLPSSKYEVKKSLK